MFDRDSLIRLTYSVVVAIIITLLTLVLTTNPSGAAFYLLKGMFAGTVIWLLGEVLFSLCEKLYPKSVLVGYVVLVFLILVGTSGFGYIFGVKDIWMLVMMSIAAEICGISITLFYRRKYANTLNERLAERKNEL